MDSAVIEVKICEFHAIGFRSELAKATTNQAFGKCSFLGFSPRTRSINALNRL